MVYRHVLFSLLLLRNNPSSYSNILSFHTGFAQDLSLLGCYALPTGKFTSLHGVTKKSSICDYTFTELVDDTPL